MLFELSNNSEDSIVSLVSPCPIFEVPYLPEPTRPAKKMKRTQHNPKVSQKLKAVQKPPQRKLAVGQLA